MKRWMLVSVALSVAVGLGCDKKKTAETPPPGTGGTPTAPATGDGKEAPKTGDPTAPTVPPVEVKAKYADTSAIWALAPADATFGLVVADGVGAKAIDLLAHGRKKLEGKAFAKKPLEQIDAWRKEQPIDPFDPASFKGKGIDLSKGMAVFGLPDTSKPGLVILPAGDLVELRKLMEATTEKVGDREIDKIKELVCTTAGGRYVCAVTVEAIDAAMKPHDSPLAAAVKALPVEARGDVEGYVEIAKTPEIAKEFEELKPFGDFAVGGGALRVDLTAINLHLWGKGTMSPIATAFAAVAPPAELGNATAGATTILRAKVEPKLALAQAPPQMPFNEVDIRTDLLDQLTGDMQLVTAGKGMVAGAVQLKILDAAKVKKVVAAICAEAKKGGQIPVTSVVAKDDSCAGEVSLAMLKEMIGVELPPFKFNFVVTDTLFTLAFGDLDLASLKGSVADAAGSPEAKEAITGAQTVTFWTRGLGVDVAALPKALADKALSDPEAADGIALLNFIAAQAYELSAAASVNKDGAKLTVHMTSMETDPAEAKAAYFAAVDKKLAGDQAGYAAAMADVEKKFGGSLAARRAAMERTGSPIVGPVGAAVVGAAGSAFWFLKMAGEGFTKATAPGFGEPLPDQPTEPTAPPTEEGTKPTEEGVKPPEEGVKPTEEPKPTEEGAKPTEEPKPTETKPPEEPKPEEKPATPPSP